LKHSLKYRHGRCANDVCLAAAPVQAAQLIGQHHALLLALITLCTNDAHAGLDVERFAIEQRL
jgi:hypothetical protein